MKYVKGMRKIERGKTEILRMLAGFEQPDEGNIEILNEDKWIKMYNIDRKATPGQSVDALALYFYLKETQKEAYARNYL